MSASVNRILKGRVFGLDRERQSQASSEALPSQASAGPGAHSCQVADAYEGESRQFLSRHCRRRQACGQAENSKPASVGTEGNARASRPLPPGTPPGEEINASALIRFVPLEGIRPVNKPPAWNPGVSPET
jgi:hypothetical protein